MISEQTKRRILQQQRLQHQLEIQSRQIERVFTHHRVPAQVAGGTVQSRLISFDLHSQLASGIERLRELTQDLRAVLGVPEVRLSREGGRLRLHVARTNEAPVSLLGLLQLYSDLPALTATLGLAEDGRPVLLSFNEEGMTHVLLAGGPKAGKTTLLRTLAVSLALSNKQSRLQLLVIDPEPAGVEAPSTDLEPLNYLPHMLTTVVHRVGEAADVLKFLAGEMTYRQQQEVATPTIVVLVENIVSLLERGVQPIIDMVTQLLQRGAGVGIHLVLSARRPDAPLLDNLLRANLPVRIVGRVRDGYEAAAASGVQGSQAELLLGEGDFLAVSNGAVTHFQAAFIGDYDLHLSLEQLYNHRGRVLLAHSFNVRHTLPLEAEETVVQSQTFSVNSAGISLDEVGRNSAGDEGRRSEGEAEAASDYLRMEMDE